MWRLAPFYLALIAAPLLFGGVKTESQAVIGFLLSLSLLLTHKERTPGRFLPAWLTGALLTLIVIPLIPLPAGLVEWISPERARLAVQFPINDSAPSWLALSTSPSRSIQRLWELSLALAAFVLARHAAARPHATTHLAISLAAGMALLGASDIWSRANGRETVLGLWSISWGKGAGTFANRNHFANWINVAALVCIGWLLRQFSHRENRASPALLGFIFASTVFALVMSFLSASRAGALSFLLGSIALLLLLRNRFRKTHFALTASFLILGLVVVGLITAEPLLHRFRTEGATKSLSYKQDIWLENFRIAARFPLFGAGPGSFVRVFNHYKSAHGDGVFWHAENDFFELPLEFGFPCTVLVLASLALLAANFRADSPANAAMIAALFTFALHASFEFVSYVPSNLILAAVILGMLLVRSGAQTLPNFPIFGSRFFAITLLILSTVQFAAWFESWRAFRTQSAAHVDRSLALWPPAVSRHIGQLRLAATNLTSLPRQDQFAAAAKIDSKIDRALHLDPLNYNLRLEQAWFQLAYTTNSRRAISNAWITIRLNPLQGQIPLRFARHFARAEPDLALRFLKAVHPGVPANHQAALDLAWSITQEPAQLWELTPNNVPSILNLIHFAQQTKLFGVAAQACQALENRLTPETLARHYLEARRPEEALRLLGHNESMAAQKLRVHAFHQLNQHTNAIAAAKQFFNEPVFREALHHRLNPTPSFSELLASHKAAPADATAALLLAEKTATIEPVDLGLLAALARQFPSEPRIALLLFQSEINAKQFSAAAATAAALADILAP